MSTSPAQRNLTPAEVDQHAEELPQELLAQAFQSLFSCAQELQESNEEQRDCIESQAVEIKQLESLLEEAQKPCPNCN